MSEINWSLATPPNTLGTIADGFSKGMAMAKEHKVNNALAQFATNPDDPNAVNALIRADPRLGMQARQQQAQMANARREQEAQAREQQQQHFVQVGKLLDGVTDEQTYQQRLAMARQMGMPVANAPPSFDPNWVNETRAVAHVFTKDGGQTISGIARELEDAGYKQGTPEFQQAMKGVIQNKYASDYVDENGDTRRRSALQLGGAPQAAPAAPAGHPTPGAVVNGFTFKGGDPKDRNNWTQGGPAQQSPGTFRGGFSGLSGETVTSTYRTPAHNKEVGGVANSYHTRRYPDGSPMARDSVPPRGMSMGTYAAELRRQNPHLDVINEGDHVHLEPKG